MTSTETTILLRLLDRMDALIGALHEGRARWNLKDAAASLAISEDALKTRLAKHGLKFGRGERIAFSTNVYRAILTDLLNEERERMGQNHGRGNRKRHAGRSAAAVAVYDPRL
jgi:hypothetical protein